MKRCLTLLFALVLALGLVACSGEEDTAPQIPAGTAVEVMTVTRGDLAASSTVTGNVVANRDVPVMPPVAGKVKEVKVNPGDAVQKGDVLFVMDTADLRDTYDTLLTSYESTKTMMDEQVRQAQQALEMPRPSMKWGRCPATRWSRPSWGSCRRRPAVRLLWPRWALTTWWMC